MEIQLAEKRAKRADVEFSVTQQKHWFLKKLTWGVYSSIDVIEAREMEVIEDVTDRHSKWFSDKAEHDSQKRRRH